jgi:hypothetical protein
MTVILANLKDAGQNPEVDGSPECVREQYALAELERQSPNAYPILPPDGPFRDELRQSVQPNDGTVSPLSEELRTKSSEQEQLPGRMWGKSLCDSRLKKLDIRYWTGVPIGDAVAARVISTYLEIDHPLLGFFDPESFLATFTNPDISSHGCSSVLVNALLYWATVSNAHLDSQAAITDKDMGSKCTAERTVRLSRLPFHSVSKPRSCGKRSETEIPYSMWRLRCSSAKGTLVKAKIRLRSSI